MGRHRIDLAALEERARVHAARIEEQDDELARLNRALRTADAEHLVQARIIRHRNWQLIVLANTVKLLLGCLNEQAEPAVLDTGTPGVEVTV